MQKTCQNCQHWQFRGFFLPQFLGNPQDSQETGVGKTLKMLMLAILACFLHLTGPLVAISAQILVEEVISFQMSTQTSKSVKN